MVAIFLYWKARLFWSITISDNLQSTSQYLISAKRKWTARLRFCTVAMTSTHFLMYFHLTEPGQPGPQNYTVSPIDTCSSCHGYTWRKTGNQCSSPIDTRDFPHGYTGSASRPLSGQPSPSTPHTLKLIVLKSLQHRHFMPASIMASPARIIRQILHRSLGRCSRGTQMS